MKHFIVLLLIGLFMSSSLKAQIKIGDNPQNIDPSSVLELESSSRVLVITRVTTSEMNAIVPSQGALVYNTDIQCVHYYNGTAWVNLCESANGNGDFTTDPIVNAAAGLSTIVITPTADGNNFEVALNSIQSDQIQDGGIIGADIQDNSITANKLSDDSVGRNELATNAVGFDAIDFSELNLASFANTPGFLTSANIVSTDPDNDIESRTDGAFFDQQPLLDAIDTNSTAIIDHITADSDIDVGNEILDVTTGNTSLERSGTGTALDPFTIAVNTNGITENEIADNAVTSAKIFDGTITTDDILNATIVDEDISATAAIDGTKINPNFVDQNISTTGTLAAGNTTITGTLGISGQTTINDGPNSTSLPTDRGTVNQVLTTNGTGIATWQDQVTELPVLTDAQIIVANATGNPTAATITGDASISNVGELTITPNIIDNADISATAAIDGTKINPDFGAQNTATTGTLAAGNTTITGTLGISGQTTINDGPNSTSLPTDRGTVNQVLTTDGTGIATWQDQATEFPALTDAQIIVADATGNPTAATITGDASISNTGILTIANNAVTADKIGTAGGTDANKILGTNALGDPLWVNRTGIIPTGTAGSIFFSDGAGNLAENNPWLFWDNIANQLRIGPTNTTNTIFRVNGLSRFQGTINSDGSAATPSYRFNNDPDSGIYSPAADEIGFSVGEQEALRIDEYSVGNTQILIKDRLGIGFDLIDNSPFTGTDVNSILEVKGSISKSIIRTTVALTLDETHHTIIITGNHNIILPLANSCTGRVYIIKNPSAFFTVNIDSYFDSFGVAASTIPNGATQLQSDGTDWQQIN